MSVSIVPSILDAVTVYAQGAVCTRIATLKPEGGKWPTRVRVGDLPVGLRSGSLRAFVRKGPAGLSVRDVRAEWAVTVPEEVDVPAQTKAVEAAELRYETVVAQVQRLQGRAQLLKNLRPTEWRPKEGELPKPSSVSSILQLGEFAEGELEPVQRELLAKEEELKEASDDLNEKRRRLQEASSSVRSQRTVVQRAAVLTLSEGTGDGPIELVVEYAINGARWVPAYDLTLSRALDSGSLRLRANLMQRTGEDWSQVKLSLSTANLDRRAVAPELKSLRIGR
ncbi:MAG: mucoidy inhibitor MuiA family protein, partial [Myxococcaceae bacterium]